MKKFRIKFNGSWLIFLAIYVVLFSFSLITILTTDDECIKGKPVAMFGRMIFDVFAFPIFTIWEKMGGSYNFHYQAWIMVVFILNLIINCLFITCTCNQVYLWIRHRFRKVHKA